MSASEERWIQQTRPAAERLIESARLVGSQAARAAADALTKWFERKGPRGYFEPADLARRVPTARYARRRAGVEVAHQLLGAAVDVHAANPGLLSWSDASVGSNPIASIFSAR